MFQVRPSNMSPEVRYTTGDWQSGQQASRFAVSAESRNLISAARNESGVGNVWPLFGEKYLISQETDAQNGGPAEGCVRDS